MVNVTHKLPKALSPLNKLSNFKFNFEAVNVHDIFTISKCLFPFFNTDFNLILPIRFKTSVKVMKTK